MFFEKSVIGSVIIILNLFAGLSVSENDKCGEIEIEGGERGLKKLFNELYEFNCNEFYEIQNAINDLKSRFEEHREVNESMNKELTIFDQRYDTLPEKCAQSSLPKDCAAATMCTRRSGIYRIYVEQLSNETLFVECDTKTENGDWLVIQRRQDGSVDFYRNWEAYENGFGDIDGEFFIGLKKLHALTNNNGTQELLIVMEDSKQKSVYAKYDSFSIGNATEFYTLKKIGKYSGNAGNSLQSHVGMKFSTKDRENDVDPKRHCAQYYTAAYWYEKCYDSNLNGVYNDKTEWKGVIWKTFGGGTNTLPYVKMMIRRRLN